jgi:acetyltransferase-like isoleucine patch superfamily enzyme
MCVPRWPMRSIRFMDSQPRMSVAAGGIVDDSVIVGYPPHRAPAEAGSIGPGAHLRSGTVVYAGSVIGAGFATGHNVVIREQVRIGAGVSVWSNTVIDYGCLIGDRVKIHSNCYVAQYTELEDDVFLAPGVTVANDLYPGNQRSAETMGGPLIREGAQIGVNVTLLPYVTIGRGAIVGAGSVVTRDIPDLMVAYGNPAVPVRRVPDQPSIDERLRDRRSSRFAVHDQLAMHVG